MKNRYKIVAIANLTIVSITLGMSDSPLLHRAAFTDNVTELKKLLENLTDTADLEIKDQNGYTALHCAALSRTSDTAQLLLDAGADPGHGTHNTPLLTAAKCKNFETAELLLKRGANVMATKNSGHACGSSDEGATALHYAAMTNDMQMAKLLINYGAEIDNVRGKWISYTPLHDAVNNNNLAMAWFLLQNEANANAVAEGKFTLKNYAVLLKVRHTPLHMAVAEDYQTMAKLLIDSGADIQAKGCMNYQPLHFARSPEVAQMLLDAGANLHATSRTNKSPLQLAVATKSAAANLLLAHTENYHSQQGNGASPLHCLVEKFEARPVEIPQSALRSMIENGLELIDHDSSEIRSIQNEWLPSTGWFEDQNPCKRLRKS